MKPKLYRIEVADETGQALYDPRRVMAGCVIALSLEDAIETFRKQTPNRILTSISDTGSEVLISDKAKAL